MTLGSLRNGRLSSRVLDAYQLGRLDFEELLVLQRRLVYEVSGNRTPILLLCEHPHGISIGREGSAAHIKLEAAELHALGWPVRWVNRGGGCLLHAPGQIGVYPIFALDQFDLNVREYLDRLHEIIRSTLGDFDIPSEVQPGAAGVFAAGRRIAHVGIAVRDWVSYYGVTLNVDPNLKPFRSVDCDGDPRPMTSLERERRVPVQPAEVRQRLLARFAESFGFDRVSLFHHHPLLNTKVPAHAVVTHSG